MSAPDNGENEITDLDRRIAEQVAGMYPDGMEPDYEWSAQTRREIQSEMMYVEVYGLPYACAQALVKAVDHESYAQKNGCLTPAVAHAIAEVRRLAWAKADNDTVYGALMDSFNAVHEERMKP